MKDELLKASLEYFRSMPIFCRLLKGFCEKYRSYGDFRGSVQLSLRNEEEREALEGFFGRSYRNRKSASVSAQAFQKALLETRFAAVSPEDLLAAFNGAPLLGKREAELRRRELVRNCWQRSITDQEGTASHCPAAIVLLRSLREMSSAEAADASSKALTALVHQMMSGQQEASEEVLLDALGRQLEFLTRALDLLTNLRQQSHYQYLPVFAASLTGDPHALDPGSENAHLFALLLQWRQSLEETSEVSVEAASLKRQALYLSAGILLDDVSNYAMLCGVEADVAEGMRHEGMTGFAAAGEPVNVPLSVLAKWQHIHCRDNTLWIVENPVVYAVLAEHWKKRSLMCMNGQPRLSAWLILRLLKKDRIRVYYAGDFDPEGLCIAERVQQSLTPEQFSFWHMTEGDYARAISQKPVEDRRLKMLDRLRDPLLQKTAAAIRRKGFAGYQENILSLYLAD